MTGMYLTTGRWPAKWVVASLVVYALLLALGYALLPHSNAAIWLVPIAAAFTALGVVSAGRAVKISR